MFTLLSIRKSAGLLLITAVLAAASLSLGSPRPACAASSLNESSVLNVLAALEVMTGDGSGSLNLDSPVTRA